MLVTIGSLKKNLSRAYSGNFPETTAKNTPPPLSRESGNTHLVPLYIRVGAGGGGGLMSNTIYFINLFKPWSFVSFFPGPVDRSGYRGTPRLPGELAARLDGDRRLQAEPVHAGRREVKGRRPGWHVERRKELRQATWLQDPGWKCGYVKHP